LCKSELLANTKFSVQLLLALFNLLEENVVASWYSSMLYFLIGIIAFFAIWLMNKRAIVRMKKYWMLFGFSFRLFFSIVFWWNGVLSWSNWRNWFLKSIGNGKDTGWFIFHFVIGAIGISMCLFFSLKFKRYPFPLAMNLLAILLLLSNPLQEEFEMEAWRSSLNQLTWKRPMLFIILEEGSEIFASFFFLYSFTVYLIKKTIISYSGKTMLSIDFTFNKYFLSSWLHYWYCLVHWCCRFSTFLGLFQEEATLACHKTGFHQLLVFLVALFVFILNSLSKRN